MHSSPTALVLLRFQQVLLAVSTTSYLYSYNISVYQTFSLRDCLYRFAGHTSFEKVALCTLCGDLLHLICKALAVSLVLLTQRPYLRPQQYWRDAEVHSEKLTNHSEFPKKSSRFFPVLADVSFPQLSYSCCLK